MCSYVQSACVLLFAHFLNSVETSAVADVLTVLARAAFGLPFNAAHVILAKLKTEYALQFPRQLPAYILHCQRVFASTQR